MRIKENLPSDSHGNQWMSNYNDRWEYEFEYERHIEQN